MKFKNYPIISMKSHPNFTEEHLQNAIADDPSILGLGSLIYIGRERIQSSGGKLDLLLSDDEDEVRYTVEIQLGKTDPSHIIRAVEYWDLERKHRRNFDHIAVIIAEEITRRYFNVISLLGDSIPIIAIQTSAIETPDGIGLIFNKVHDTVDAFFGYPESDEPELSTDRAYWESRGSLETIEMADSIIEMINEFIPSATLNYNKHYIGIKIGGKSVNFVILRPQKNEIRFEPKLPRTEELDSELENEGLNVMDYDSRYQAYKIKLRETDIVEHREFLHKLLRSAFELRDQS
ncbi:MAG: hypothetical protein HKN18_11275 [Silicimonas sp.]|nr:hypothetical protein [Silicimonas sp.]